MAIVAGGMGAQDDWEDRTKLATFMAKRLVQKRVSLFLGAGVSAALRLPMWGPLIDSMFSNARVPRPVPPDNTRDPETLLVGAYAGDAVRFAEAVRVALYEDFKLSDDELDVHPVLSALGALALSSVRGAAVNVVTFNYDDLLESYLSWRGLVVTSVPKLPEFNGDYDVQVLHPHGLLHKDFTKPVTSGVVMTQLEYDKIVGDSGNFWRQRITDILRSTTPLFIGLSGVDENLRNMLTSVMDVHPSRGNDFYWGLRLTAKGDSNGDIWTRRGVCSFELGRHEELPVFLLDICRRAAGIRASVK